jgi:hypothetical protein
MRRVHYILLLMFCGLEQHSGYSISLQAGQSGDLIQVWARFSAVVQTGPGDHLASCTVGKVLFPGGKAPGPSLHSLF